MPNVVVEHLRAGDLILITVGQGADGDPLVTSRIVTTSVPRVGACNGPDSDFRFLGLNDYVPGSAVDGVNVFSAQDYDRDRLIYLEVRRGTLFTALDLRPRRSREEIAHA